MPMGTLIALIVLGVLCLAGAVLVMRYAFTYDKHGKPAPPAEPLPGSEGGGWYTLHVEGLQNDAAPEQLMHALQAVPSVTAVQADPETGIVRVQYTGFPALDLLDSLQDAAARAGCPVTDIE